MTIFHNHCCSFAQPFLQIFVTKKYHNGSHFESWFMWRYSRGCDGVGSANLFVKIPTGSAKPFAKMTNMSLNRLLNCEHTTVLSFTITLRLIHLDEGAWYFSFARSHNITKYRWLLTWLTKITPTHHHNHWNKTNRQNMCNNRKIPKIIITVC